MFFSQSGQKLRLFHQSQRAISRSLIDSIVEKHQNWSTFGPFFDTSGPQISLIVFWVVRNFSPLRLVFGLRLQIRFSSEIFSIIFSDFFSENFDFLVGVTDFLDIDIGLLFILNISIFFLLFFAVDILGFFSSFSLIFSSKVFIKSLTLFCLSPRESCIGPAPKSDFWAKSGPIFDSQTFFVIFFSSILFSSSEVFSSFFFSSKISFSASLSFFFLILSNSNFNSDFSLFGDIF